LTVPLVAGARGGWRLSGSIATVAVDLDLTQLHRLSVDEYHRILEAGGFDEDARVELLGGLLAAMSPKTRAHENAVAWLARWAMRGVDLDAFEVRVASPLTLEDSEPEPDLAVIALGAPRPYHPGTATLIVEISASSLARDLGAKAELYTRAGVPEYWVLDLDHRQLIVKRDARPAAGEYSEGGVSI
jgi:Uma2 family endonuclease